MQPISVHPSPNHGPRPDGAIIDMLVLHYTGMVDADAALQRMTDVAAEVSAHYMVREDGTIYQLVDEARRAWHAGVACWRGYEDINSRSVGIELVNPGHEFGYRAFPEPQMTALISLATGIVARHTIAARNIIGHSDVAPARKTDPGELFNWQRLAATGLGLWPKRTNGDLQNHSSMLAQYGYDTRDTGAALTAFQRHFRPTNIDGKPDDECAQLLAGLLEHIRI